MRDAAVAQRLPHVGVVLYLAQCQPAYAVAQQQAHSRRLQGKNVENFFNHLPTAHLHAQGGVGGERVVAAARHGADAEQRLRVARRRGQLRRHHCSISPCSW